MSAFSRAAAIIVCTAAATFLGLPTRVSAQSLAATVDRLNSAGFEGQVMAADGARVTFDRTSGQAPGRAGWIWGSISKQVSAVLAMMEVEAGRLRLEDRVKKWLPEFRGKPGGEATVRDLLQHTSGLYNPSGAGWDAGPPAFYTRTGPNLGGRSDAVGICASPAAGERGTFRYNNCDTIVLGAILEQASGQPFAALLRSRLTRPLGLRSVRLARSGEQLRPMPDVRVNVATFGASGAIVGTATDLVRLSQALMNGRLLSPASLATLWEGNPRLGYVALGAWGFSAPLRGCQGAVRLVERRGAVAGVQSRNIIAPDLKRALVVFTPKSDFDFGEIWRGSGPSYDLASAAFCGANTEAAPASPAR